MDKIRAHDLMVCPRCNNSGGITASKLGDSVLLECDSCSWGAKVDAGFVERLIERHKAKAAMDDLLGITTYGMR